MFLEKSSFFYNFYKNFNKSIINFNKFFDINKTKIQFTLLKKSVLNEISFLDPYIKSHIYKNYIYAYKFSHSSFKTVFYFASSSQILTPYIKNEGLRLYYLILLFQYFCNKSINQQIYYYPSSFKKEFPKSISSSLSPREVNSGVTFIENASHHHLNNGKIILFRKEEVYKVCIHELIHSFHMDYPLIIHSKRVHNNLCSNYPILLNEAYTEALATMINLYLVYLMKEKLFDKSGIININDNYIINVNKLRIMFKNELSYELGLSKEILKHNGLKYNELNKLVKEDVCLKEFSQSTNVFSYYVLKPLLLNDIDYYDNFMKNNTNNGFIIKDSINILESYVLETLRNEKSHYVKSLKNAILHKSRSLKMVYYQL